MSAATIGSAALWGAVGVGALCLVPGLDARITRRLLGTSALLALVSTTVLVVALVVNDFSMAYVADTTSFSTPWLFRVAALWGGMDGSMLFYATLTLAVGWIGARRLQLTKIGLAVVALVGVGYLLMTAIIANPFVTLPIPAVDGAGLLGILQHPAMIYHPPILYLGLTVLVVPAALTVESYVHRDLGSSWVRTVRRWLVFSWTFLTLGMVAGASWAYIELGWGGFWAWDPVENTALMPWLAITAFMHTSRIQQRDGRVRRLNVFIVLIAFSLTVLGVYLTRSGATGSIHSFAEDPVIGQVLLTSVVVALVASVALSIRSEKGEPWARFGPGRDTWLAVNTVLMLIALTFVAVGSAYPAFAQVFADAPLTIDSRFFTTTVYPIGLVVAALLALAMKTRWQRSTVGWRDLALLMAGAGAAGAVVWLVAHAPTVATATLFALAASSLVALLTQMVRKRPARNRWPGLLAHVGIAMVFIGAAGSSMGGDGVAVMAPGDTLEVAGHEIVMKTIKTGETDRFLFAEAELVLDGQYVLTPQIRAYGDQDLPIAEPAIRSTPGGDVIVAISLLFPDAAAADVSVFVRPVVWWVWAGALVVALGGLLLIGVTAADGAKRHREARAEPQQADTTI